MATPYRPAKSKPVKRGRELIGFVSSKPEGPLGYYAAYRIKADGSADRMGGSSSQARSISMVREDYDERTLPQRPWHVRTKNGSTVIVEASTEKQALMRANTVLRRWFAEALEPANARVADPEFDDFRSGPLALQFGAMKLDSK